MLQTLTPTVPSKKCLILLADFLFVCLLELFGSVILISPCRLWLYFLISSPTAHQAFASSCGSRFLPEERVAPTFFQSGAGFSPGIPLQNKTIIKVTHTESGSQKSGGRSGNGIPKISMVGLTTVVAWRANHGWVHTLVLKPLGFFSLGTHHEVSWAPKREEPHPKHLFRVFLVLLTHDLCLKLVWESATWLCPC